MEIYHVVAAANGRVIGKANRLPWHFSADLRHFKKLTTGHTVLMGRRTFESIGKPLPGRRNLVVSRSARPPLDGIEFFRSPEEALAAVRTEKCFIIGGAQLYAATIGRVLGIYLTRIHGDYEGDAFYPEIGKAFLEKTREVLQEEPKIEVIYYERNRI